SLHKIEGAAEFALVPDQLGIRFAGTFEDSDGYVKNLSGKDSGGAKSYAVRATLLYRSVGGFEAMLKGYAARSKGGQENVFIVNGTPDGIGPVTFGGIGEAFGVSYDRSHLDLLTVDAPAAG